MNWIDGKGNKIDIDTMSKEHLQNVLKMTVSQLRNAQQMYNDLADNYESLAAKYRKLATPVTETETTQLFNNSFADDIYFADELEDYNF
jgi:hypothetical protein